MKVKLLVFIFLGIWIFACKKNETSPIENLKENPQKKAGSIFNSPKIEIQLSKNGTSITVNVTTSGYISPNPPSVQVGISGSDGFMTSQTLGPGGGTFIFNGTPGVSYTFTGEMLIGSVRVTTVRFISLSPNSPTTSCTYPNSLATPSFPESIPYAASSGGTLYQGDGEILILFPTDAQLGVKIVLRYKKEYSTEDWSYTAPFTCAGTQLKNGDIKTYYIINNLESGTTYTVQPGILCNDKFIECPNTFNRTTIVL